MRARLLADRKTTGEGMRNIANSRTTLRRTERILTVNPETTVVGELQKRSRVESQETKGEEDSSCRFHQYVLLPSRHVGDVPMETAFPDVTVVLQCVRTPEERETQHSQDGAEGEAHRFHETSVAEVCA